MRKIREGLTLLIEGLIDDTNDMIDKEGSVKEIIDVANFRVGLIEGYLNDAERYILPKDKLVELKSKYAGLKSKLKGNSLSYVGA